MMVPKMKLTPELVRKINPNSECTIDTTLDQKMYIHPNIFFSFSGEKALKAKYAIANIKTAERIK